MNFQEWFVDNKSVKIRGEIRLGDKWELVKYVKRMSVGYICFDNDPDKALEILNNAFWAFDERRGIRDVWVSQGCVCSSVEHIFDHTANLGFTRAAKFMKEYGIYCRAGYAHEQRTPIGQKYSVRNPSAKDVVEYIRSFVEDLNKS